MTHEGLSSPFIPLGAPKRCDMDYIYCAYITFVQSNFCRQLNHTALFWGNALAGSVWGSPGRGEVLLPMSSRGFLAVSLERVQHSRTCVVKAGEESTHRDARPDWRGLCESQAGCRCPVSMTPHRRAGREMEAF